MQRKTLKSGTLLNINGIEYRIKRCLSRGGYSLVYEADCRGMESGKKIVIKEFFPVFAERDGERVVPKDGVDEAIFKKLREGMKAESLLSGDAGNYTYQVLHVEHADTEKGYIVMAMNSEDMVSLADLLTMMEDEKYLPCRDFCYPSTDRVHYALKVISSILAGLSAVHEKAQILHCDISPYNVYWAGQDIRTGLHCEAFFLDFGSAVKLEENHRIRISGAENIPKSMPGHGAPEKNHAQYAELTTVSKENYEQYVELTPAADLYSVAVLLAVLCCGSSICKDNTNWIPCDIVSFHHRRLKKEIDKLSLEPDVKKSLLSIIVKGLQQNPEERYQSARDMQKDILELQEACVPKKAQLLCKAPDPVRSFVGREEELQELKGLLEQGYHTIFITGDAGLGKTELALKLAQELKNDYSVYQTVFSESLEQTIANLPIDVIDKSCDKAVNNRKEVLEKNSNTVVGDKNERTENDKDIYRKKYECLKSYRSTDILIIDNFDFSPSAEKEMRNSKEYQDLLKLDMKIIFTSRVHVSGTAVRLKEMSTDQLLRLMKIHYSGEGDDAVLRQLISVVVGHTLTVELMAKTMENSWGEITPELMLNVLTKQEYDYPGFEPVLSEKDGNRQELRIYEHLKRLFQMAMLDESSKKIMSQSVLLPQNGMTAFLFLKCHDEREKKIIRGLEKGGWLHKTSDNLLKLHPLIKEICIRELGKNDEICEEFLYPYRLYLNENFEEMPVIYRIHAAEIFGNASDYLADGYGYYTRLAAEFFEIVGQYRKSLQYYMKFNGTKLTGRESAAELVKLNERMADVYLHLGKYEEALAHEKRALALLETDFDNNRLLIARIYHNCSSIYKEKGDYESALEWSEKAEALECDDAYHQAYLSMNRGKIDFKMGNYKIALERCEKAMQFFCKEPQRYYMEIASLATTVGIIHEEYQEYEAAVQCYEIAKDIYMEKLGTEHPNTASSYNDLGYALIKLERYEEALRYLKESCRIKEREFGTEHRYTANTYHTLGQAYTGLGDYEKALEYCKKAGDFRLKTFGVQSMEMADSFSLYADIYLQMGEYETAYQCAWNVFQIYRMLYPNHPRVQMAFERMQYIAEKRNL